MSNNLQYWQNQGYSFQSIPNTEPPKFNGNKFMHFLDKPFCVFRFIGYDYFYGFGNLMNRYETRCFFQQRAVNKGRMPIFGDIVYCYGFVTHSNGSVEVLNVSVLEDNSSESYELISSNPNKRKYYHGDNTDDPIKRRTILSVLEGTKEKSPYTNHINEVCNSIVNKNF